MVKDGNLLPLQGKNLYYDWHTRHGQWEKPDALKSEQMEKHVLPSNDKDKTMSELSESQQLWMLGTAQKRNVYKAIG